MKYNPHIKGDREKALEEVEKYCAEGKPFEVVARRTNRQNRYLHLIFTLFAIEHFGSKSPYWVGVVKQLLFKRIVNRHIYVTMVYEFGKESEIIRSTADVSKEQTREAIQNFIDHAWQEYGIIIPPPEDEETLRALEEYERNFQPV